MSTDSDFDFALALELQNDLLEVGDYDEVYESPRKKSKFSHSNDKPLSIVDESWELIDPVPDIRELFVQFNQEYFEGMLAGVEVKWSPRMTLCAGLCCYEGRGGLCSIRLSQPLLKLRPRKDLVQTLLHEMIHALLFVTDNNKDHDGHGPEFHKHMYRINKASGANITVYHTFHDEVNEYRQHWWRCNGPCVRRPPFYGIVRRAMNRAPSNKDPWWADHKSKCGGEFIKIKEPEGYGKKKIKSKAAKDSKSNSSKESSSSVGKTSGNKTSGSLDMWFKTPSSTSDATKSSVDKENSAAPHFRNSDVLNTSTFWNPKAATNIHTYGDVSATSEDNPEMQSKRSSQNPNLSARIHSFSGSGTSSSRIPSKAAAFSGTGHVLGGSESAGKNRMFSSTKSLNGSASNSLRNSTSSNAAISTTFIRSHSTSSSASSSAANLPTSSVSVATLRSSTSVPSSVLSTSASWRSLETDSASKTIDNTPSGSSISKNSQISLSNSEISLSSAPSRVQDNMIDLTSDAGGTLKYNFSPPSKQRIVECPSCVLKVPENEINSHLDRCLA